MEKEKDVSKATIPTYDMKKKKRKIHLVCYYMECSVSPMRPTYYLLQTTEIYFQILTSIGLEVIYENPSQVPEYRQLHVSYILSNTKSSSTQIKVLSNWSKITTFVFPHITSSIKCISKFFIAMRKCLEQMKPFESSSSLNVICFGLLFESFGNHFYYALVLKCTNRKCISSSQR